MATYNSIYKSGPHDCELWTNLRGVVGVAGKPISSFTHLPMRSTKWRLECSQFMWATMEFLQHSADGVDMELSMEYRLQYTL